MMYITINILILILNIAVFVLGGIALFKYEYFLSKKVAARGEAYKKETKEIKETVQRETKYIIETTLDSFVRANVKNEMHLEIFNILEKAFDSILHHHLWKDEDNVIRKSIINLMIEEIIKVKSKDLKND